MIGGKQDSRIRQIQAILRENDVGLALITPSSESLLRDRNRLAAN